MYILYVVYTNIYVLLLHGYINIYGLL